MGRHLDVKSVYMLLTTCKDMLCIVNCQYNSVPEHDVELYADWNTEHYAEAIDAHDDEYKLLYCVEEMAPVPTPVPTPLPTPLPTPVPTPVSVRLGKEYWQFLQRRLMQMRFDFRCHFPDSCDAMPTPQASYSASMSSVSRHHPSAFVARLKAGDAALYRQRACPMPRRRASTVRPGYPRGLPSAGLEMARERHDWLKQGPDEIFWTFRDNPDVLRFEAGPEVAVQYDLVAAAIAAGPEGMVSEDPLRKYDAAGLRLPLATVWALNSTDDTLNWKTYFTTDCRVGFMSYAVFRNTIHDLAIRAAVMYKDLVYKAFSADVMVFQNIPPAFCKHCQTICFDECDCGPVELTDENPQRFVSTDHTLSNPVRYRLVVRVCESALQRSVELVYLHKLGALPASEFILATCLAEASSFSVMVSDGHSRLAINVREPKFEKLVFCAQRSKRGCKTPDNPLEGALLLVTLREQDALGVFCRNITRQYNRNSDRPDELYPGPYQAMSFVATDVEFVGWSTETLEQDDQDTFEPLELWNCDGFELPVFEYGVWHDGGGQDSPGDDSDDSAVSGLLAPASADGVE